MAQCLRDRSSRWPRSHGRAPGSLPDHAGLDRDRPPAPGADHYVATPRDGAPEVRAVKFRLAFLLEQTLGHVAHTKNIERALSSHPWVEPTVIKLPFDARPRPTAWVPGGRNWSVRASLMARRGLAQRLRQGALDAVFVHTQVAALLSTGLFARVPTVISLDATPRDFDEVGFAYGHRRQARWLEELKAALNRRALAGATALVTWSRQAARSLSEHYGVDPDRITVIRPGVDLGLFRPSPAPRSPVYRQA
ncbi:MAG: hypothetical protein E6I08_01745 [Chloroflexi bacterium]|nr:MAG: hypothetical protein E6I08_01745 [Chloroflexota bacterium]